MSATTLTSVEIGRLVVWRTSIYQAERLGFSPSEARRLAFARWMLRMGLLSEVLGEEEVAGA